MNTFALLVLVAFAPAASILFRILSLQWAVSATAIGGFLFLPVMRIHLPGLPDYSKPLAISMALVLGLLVRGKALPRAVHFRWLDVLFVIWIFAQPISYLANGYPLYNALSSLFMNIMTWAVPYWVGRACFQSPGSVRVLLHSLVIGGLVYVPLALWEVRMSPQLHKLLYGSGQHSFGQMIRGGGFRPMVFTQHGLVVALWFAVTLAAAISLRRLSNGKANWTHKAWWLVPGLILMLALCKSLGALGLGLIAAASLSSRGLRIALPLLLLASSCYVMGRIFFDEATYQSVTHLLGYIPEERAQSFQFRMDMERLVLAKAREQPWFGWVTEGFRHLNTDDGSESVVTTDSLWIIVFGSSGFVGLFSLYSVLMAGATRSLRDASVSGLIEAQALSAIVAIQLLDTVSNGVVTPVAVLTTGAALGLLARRRRRTDALWPPPPRRQRSGPLRPRTINHTLQRIDHAIRQNATQTALSRRHKHRGQWSRFSYLIHYKY